MDEADRAKEYEMQDRQIALQNALSAPDKGRGESQKSDSSGIVICLDCERPIDPQRLKIKPNAVRCVGCKTAWESKQ